MTDYKWVSVSSSGYQSLTANEPQWRDGGFSSGPTSTANPFPIDCLPHHKRQIDVIQQPDGGVLIEPTGPAIDCRPQPAPSRAETLAESVVLNLPHGHCLSFYATISVDGKPVAGLTRKHLREAITNVLKAEGL